MARLARCVRRRAALVVALALLGTALGLGFSLLAPSQYEASTRLFVSATRTADGQLLPDGSATAESRVRSYARLATSDQVLRAVAEDLKLPYSTTDLAARITADAAPGTVLIDVRARDDDPARARDLANAVAEHLPTVVHRVANLDRTGASQDVPVSLAVTSAATLPASPLRPNRLLSSGIGLTAGLLAGLSLALAGAFGDRRIQRRSDLVDVVPTPLLAEIPHHPGRTLAAFTGQGSSRAYAESFRRLRSRLPLAPTGPGVGSVLVTSADPGEGRTTTAVNLALALAHTGVDVVLIDADLHRPGVASALSLPPDVPGLTSVLTGTSELDAALRQWSQGIGLKVITSGPPVPNPGDLLATSRMAWLLRTLISDGLTLVIDTPALGSVADALTLSRECDITVVVAHCGLSSTGRLQATVNDLQTFGASVLGVVLVGVPGSASRKHKSSATRSAAPSSPRRWGFSRLGRGTAATSDLPQGRHSQPTLQTLDTHPSTNGAAAPQVGVPGLGLPEGDPGSYGMTTSAPTVDRPWAPSDLGPEPGLAGNELAPAGQSPEHPAWGSSPEPIFTTLTGLPSAPVARPTPELEPEWSHQQASPWHASAPDETPPTWVPQARAAHWTPQPPTSDEAPWTATLLGHDGALPDPAVPDSVDSQVLAPFEHDRIDTPQVGITLPRETLYPQEPEPQGVSLSRTPYAEYWNRPEEDDEMSETAVAEPVPEPPPATSAQDEWRYDLMEMDDTDEPASAEAAAPTAPDTRPWGVTPSPSAPSDNPLFNPSVPFDQLSVTVTADPSTVPTMSDTPPDHSPAPRETFASHLAQEQYLAPPTTSPSPLPGPPPLPAPVPLPAQYTPSLMPEQSPPTPFVPPSLPRQAGPAPEDNQPWRAPWEPPPAIEQDLRPVPAGGSWSEHSPVPPPPDDQPPTQEPPFTEGQVLSPTAAPWVEGSLPPPSPYGIDGASLASLRLDAARARDITPAKRRR